ncbi:MAG: hypothetical protein AABX82_09315 [Nanoarchaeota archaeon]
MSERLLLGLSVLVATSVYGAEPTLETIPDNNYPFVQENADKALKVAYIVAGKTCTAGTSLGGSTVTIPMSGGKQMYYAQLVLDTGEQTYNVSVADLLSGSIPDALTFIIYKERLSLKKAMMGFASNTQVMDQGLDGCINMGSDGKTAFHRNYMRSNGGREIGREHEPYFQDLYLKALDAVIAICEAK